MSWFLDTIYNLISHPVSQIIELPLDPRWEPFDEQQDDWYFRHHKIPRTRRSVPTLARQGREGVVAEKGLEEEGDAFSPSISVSNLVSHIQHVHRSVFQLDTTSTTVTTSATARKKGSTSASVNRTAGRSGSSMLLQNRSKSRRIQQLRHEIKMNRRRHAYNKKLLDYVLYALDNRHVLQPDAFITHSMEEEDGDNMSSSEKPVPIFHLLRDFDQIQQLYDEAVLDALEIEHGIKLMNRRRQSDIDQESETLSRLVHSYLYGPVEKDEYFRSINNRIFHEFDNDPFQLLVSEHGLQKTQQQEEDLSMLHLQDNIHLHPKPEILSMKSEEDRLKRRHLLLCTAQNDDQECKIEMERIRALLFELVGDQVLYRNMEI